MPAPGDITRLLHAAGDGSREAVDQLFPLVYGELRTLADGHLRGERAAHTLQPTALVHEAYLKLLGQDSVGFAGRGEFFGVAAQAMRRILVDHARTRGRQKRGGGAEAVPLDTVVDLLEERVGGGGGLADLDQALEQLAAQDSARARLVELRFFGGCSMAEAAAVLGMPLRSAERSWTLARAFLRAKMAGQADA